MTITLISDEQRVRELFGKLTNLPELDDIHAQVTTTRSTFSPALMHAPLFVLEDDGSGLDRLIDLATCRARVTPTREEFAMHAAYGAALRSAALRGGVGAALVDDRGDIVALGTAEVPAAGGGQYWEGDEHDARDIVFGVDPATAARAATVQRLLQLLTGMGATLPSEPNVLVDELLSIFDQDQGSSGVGLGGEPAQSFQSLGRVVHAEMAALLAAARSGARLDGAALYVTAHPCRQCLRHLVCAGLRRVVYFGQRLEAAPSFHADSVSVRAEASGRMELIPFTGVGPGLYQSFFSRNMQEITERRK
jgi:cytidine deaminase